MWIYQERLHLVPIEHTSPIPFPSSSTFEPPEEGFLDRVTAIELVRDSSVLTQAPTDLESIVWSRIDGFVAILSLVLVLILCYSYPGKISDHHHKTLTYLPVEIALALQDNPGLIAEAIAAFYERDPTGLRVRTISI